MKNLKPEEIFHPLHNQELKRAEKDNLNFAYCTNAETAYKIIDNQELWLRSITVMNDYKEFEHGKECLLNLIEETDEGKNLRKIIEDIAPGMFSKVFDNFKKYAPHLKNDLYISCFSEHKCSAQDIGRLSMWRAYGGNAGVAIVFKKDFFKWLNSFDLDFSSVAYLDKNELTNKLAEVNISILNNRATIKSLSSNELEGQLFNLLKFSALCNKHGGFREEQEWRLVAEDTIHSKKSIISKEFEVINGTPQQILKIKLKDARYNGLFFRDMISKIIIGPCRYPYVIYNSIFCTLGKLGVQDPDQIICISDIPLRFQK